MSDNAPQPHPIQLKDVLVNELSAVVRDADVARDYQGTVKIKTRMSSTPYEEGSSFVGVRVEVDIKPQLEKAEDEPCFEIVVKLEGHFEVDFTKFSPEHIDEWARVNAVYLVMPYVREQAYGMAIRVGIHGLIFPLYVMPRLPSKAPANN